jgi:hypothetical protein
MTQLYSLGDVARLLSIPQHRISYAISNQMVAESAMRVAGKRVFTDKDLVRIASYFGVQVTESKNEVQKGEER